MSSYLKYKPVWYRVMIMGSLLAGVFLIITFLTAFLITKMTNVPITEITFDTDTPEMMKATKILLLVQGLLFFTLPALIYSYLADPRPMRFLRLDAGPSMKYILLAIVAILAAGPSALWLGELNKHLDLSRTLPAVDQWIKAQETGTNKVIETLMKHQSTTDLLFNLFTMALLPAIGEELIFRGLLQKGIIRVTRNAWIGIIMSAFIFSAIHFQFLTFLARFELGIVLGVLFWYSGSLWISIIAHFVFNGLQVFMAYYLPDITETPPALVSAMAAGISFLAVIVLIIVIKRSSTVTMSEVYEDEDDDDGFVIESKDQFL